MAQGDRGYAMLEGRGVLAVGGAERVEFLQGLVTNDMRRAGPDRAVWSALLTPQGKYLHDFLVVGLGETLLLDCEAERRDDLMRRLKIYRLRAKVTIEDVTATLTVAAAFGQGAAEALGLPAEEPGAARPLDAGIAFVDPRLPALGARAILPREEATTALAAAGLPALPADRWQELRLRLGVPEGSGDMEVEKAILLENGFDALDGVAWDKGCYVGQELTARTRYRGLVKKRLVPVRVEGPMPPPGTPVTLGGRDAGQLRAGLGDRALALLRIEELDRLAEEGGELTAGEARLHPERAAWNTRL
ncbi:CAF17-like 4Fe-4S cluster assembly/insertion protein YgfZ [Arenibaculum pallidiluteum]|uniref:CAF17-like 4Fe-4S cluster assembly/insertion protein YgfZ n=1 Tax=Arenibaculum pallidiluteum TaxID=2812559 RepID=UPI001A96978D|nr:folate-binding protein YgfZ [Arenibaculum pallidiluteum]